MSSPATVTADVSALTLWMHHGGSPSSTGNNNNNNENKKVFSRGGSSLDGWATDVADWYAPYQERKTSSELFLCNEDDKDMIDVTDYILKITYWIWHEKKVDLCVRFYAPDCVLHTMSGDIVGSQTVVDNTWATLASFPDRTLDGENVVWKKIATGNDDSSSSFPKKTFSSHLIVSRMTHLGDSDAFGAATGKQVRIRTIADCVLQQDAPEDDLKIVEEWLMRDNAWLVMSLGFNLEEFARVQAQKELEQGKNILAWLEPLRQKVLQAPMLESQMPLPSPPTAQEDKEPWLRVFVETLFTRLWEQGRHEEVLQFYDYRVSCHLTAGRELYGIVELQEYLESVRAGLDGDGATPIKMTVDHISAIPFLDSPTAMDVAVRWSLVATHTGGSGQETATLWGRPLMATTNSSRLQPTPIYILGSSHFRVVRGKIREEWTVFDELALHQQVATNQQLASA